MPHVGESTLLLVDVALQSAGTLLLGVVVIRWFRTGRWRNPLAGVQVPSSGPGLLHVVGVFAAFYALAASLAGSFQVDPQAAAVPGSDAWYTLQSADAAAKIAACVLMAFILHYYSDATSRAGRPRRWLIAIAAGVAAGLVILPASYLQLEAGQTVWQWLKPTARPPMHPVLEAMERNAWGWVGIVELSFAALVAAPLAEELFFRGLLLTALWRRLGNAWLAVSLSGAAFGLIHLPLPHTVVPLATMGIILGYVRLRYRSLAACVVAHALFNGRTMAFALLNPDLLRAGW